MTDSEVLKVGMDPIEIVKQLYASNDAGDLDAVMELCSPDVVIVQDDVLPWGGRYVGRDGVAEFALKLVGTIDSQVVTHEMFVAGDRVVQYGRTHGTVRANDAAFDVPECHVFTLDAGTITSAEFYIDSTAMLEVLSR